MRSPLSAHPAVVYVLALRRSYVRAGASRAAAALAYFLVLTLFPLLLCVSSLISLFRPGAAALPGWAVPLLPPGAPALLEEYLAYVSVSRSPALFWAGLSAVFLSASAGLRAVLSTMDALYRVKSRPHTRFLPSLALSGVFLATIYLSAAVILTGEWFFGLLEHRFPVRPEVLLPAARLWGRLRFALLFCFVLLSVLLVYRLGAPRAAVSSRAVMGWAAVDSAAIVACSALFSCFVGLSARYRLVYGSLAGVILLLVWLYLCGSILLLGAVAAHTQYALRRGR